jgi:hypothetical protein
MSRQQKLEQLLVQTLIHLNNASKLMSFVEMTS